MAGDAPFDPSPIAAFLVFNPVSAAFDRAALDAAVEAAFAPGATGGDGGGRVVRFETTPAEKDEARARLVRALEDAVRDGCRLVLAAGGDGTISAVADALAALDPAIRPVLGLVPLGTANVLARELEVPIDTARAVALARAGARVVPLDAIRVGPHVYLTQVGVGLDAVMIASTTREDQRRSGRLAYLRALFREMSGWRSHTFNLTIDGHRVRKRAWQVVVANARTLGTKPFTWGPEIRPDDGVLDVGVYDVKSFGDWLALVVRFLTGRHRTDRRARFYRCAHALRIDARRALPVQGDGDLIAETPVDISVERALFQVVAGPDEKDAAAAATAKAEAVASAAPQPVVATAPGPVSAAAARAAQALRVTLWHRLAGMDHAVYRWVNRLHEWPPATWVARALSRTMDHGEAWILVSLLVAAIDPGANLGEMIAVIAILSVVSLTVNFPIKSAFRRQRPFHALADVDVRVEQLPRDWSFPSGHSATAFAGVVLLVPYVPAFTPLLFAYAGGVALSRVYLGVHYPIDVLLGGAVGMGLAVVYSTLFRLLLGMG